MVLRWGICGAGIISSDFVSALMAPPNNVHEVVCIGARCVDRARSFADKFGIKSAYGSYEEVANDPNVGFTVDVTGQQGMLNHLCTLSQHWCFQGPVLPCSVFFVGSKRLNVVYIGVIHIFHVTLSKQMLRSGKHVLCEKPMAANSTQVLEVQEVARKFNKFFMEGIWSRCFPVYRKIKEEVLSGKLGEVLHVQAQFCKANSTVERVAKPELGGGGLHNLGIYPIQLATMIFNNQKPEKITADGTVSDLGVDEASCITLTYKNGGRAVLIFSTLYAAGKNNTATIYGTKGNIELNENFWCPREAILPSGKVSNELATGPIAYNYLNSGGLRFEADCLKECIEAGKRECCEMSFADSRAVYHIIDEVVKQIGVDVKW